MKTFKDAVAGCERVMVAGAIVLVLAGGATAEEVYDASLGTLPEMQGWAKFDLGANPSPSVSGGALHQNATASSSVQSWTVQHSPISFDSAGPVLLQAELRIVGSNYVLIDQNHWRSGYALAITDENDRHLIAGISSTGVRLTNSPSWGISLTSSNFYAFDTTSSFHVYRLEVASGLARLLVDEALVLALPVGSEVPGTNWLTSTARFGDVSLHAGSEGELRYVTMSVVPEPATLSLLTLGWLSLVRKRRRNRRVHR